MTEERPWHQALTYAVFGARLSGLGEQVRPDVEVLAAELADRAAAGEIEIGIVGSWTVPEDLMAGLGAAQFLASLRRLRAVLSDADQPGGRVVSPVLTDRPLTADERRLDQDRPPHHGT